MNIFKQFWDLFTSVRLAIFTLGLLAFTSIIGTVIPQGQPEQFYINSFGPKMAKFMQILDIPDMYGSWWFLSLLTILSLNLIVCSIERFPRAWKLIHQDNTTLSAKHIKAMTGAVKWPLPKTGFSFSQATAILNKKGWKGRTISKEEGELYFSQKGKWSRLGVYIVHLSILVIFLGAAIGYFFGFRATVFIPEGQSTSRVYSIADNKPIELGFALHCNSFQVEFYPTGMPKEYMSSLTVLENDKQVKTKAIEVNSPLTYKGITFYQSSFQPFDDYLISLNNSISGEKQIFEAPFQKLIKWDQQQIEFGILAVKKRAQQAVLVKLWIKAADSPATQIILSDKAEENIKLGTREFHVKFKQLYATGLQATKDPGVWLVYLGCLLMLAGLYMAFFMSHKRLWLLLDNSSEELVLTASSNKNRLALQREIDVFQRQINDLFKK